MATIAAICHLAYLTMEQLTINDSKAGLPASETVSVSVLRLLKALGLDWASPHHSTGLSLSRPHLKMEIFELHTFSDNLSDAKKPSW